MWLCTSKWPKSGRSSYCEVFGGTTNQLQEFQSVAQDKVIGSHQYCFEAQGTCLDVYSGTASTQQREGEVHIWVKSGHTSYLKYYYGTVIGRVFPNLGPHMPPPLPGVLHYAGNMMGSAPSPTTMLATCLMCTTAQCCLTCLCTLIVLYNLPRPLLVSSS